MRWIELEIVVPAPPEEAFPWVVEPGLLREWLPQLDELRPRGFLHHRPVVRHAGLRLALDVRVTRVVVPEVVELEVGWRGAVGHTLLEVEPHEDGATVTWRVGLTLPPALRLAGPGVARELRRLMRRDLELLAERLAEPHRDGDVPGDADGPASVGADGRDAPGPTDDGHDDDGDGAPVGADGGGTPRDAGAEPADGAPDVPAGETPGRV